MKVFLGGTINSNWRERLISMIKIDYFNPVVDDWSPRNQDEELKQKKFCDYYLYCITPKMTGFYSIAEVVEHSINKPKFTIFVHLILDDGHRFNNGQWNSICAISELVKNNGAISYTSLDDAANFLNNKDKHQ